jgi:hypothetical protein
MFEIADVTNDLFAFLRDANLKEWLTVINRPSRIGDQSMRRAMAGMNVRVDEAGRQKFACGIDGRIDMAIEFVAYVNDLVSLVHNNAVANERMGSPLVGNDPGCLDRSSHLFSRAACAAMIGRRLKARDPPSAWFLIA